MVLSALSIVGITIGCVVVGGGLIALIVWLIYNVRNGGISFPRGCREDHAA